MDISMDIHIHYPWTTVNKPGKYYAVGFKA